MKATLVLDGVSLSQAALQAIARGEVQLLIADEARLRVSRAQQFLADQVALREPIYGVSTGFGSNADRLLGAHRLRGDGVDDMSLLEELQHRLIVSHAVGVGPALPDEVVRAMVGIRINTLLKGHSGISNEALDALVAMYNADIVPVVPQFGSVGASGDLAPLSHLAQVLLGHGQARLKGTVLSAAEALAKAGLQPIRLGLKEGLALNNGTALMLALGVLISSRMRKLVDLADLAHALTLEAFAGRSSAYRADVHALRAHPGQCRSAARIRALTAGSTLIDVAYHLVPRFRTLTRATLAASPDPEASFDVQWDWVSPDERHGRERFYQRFLPFRGGKKLQPQDSYSLRCAPQVHGAVRDALDHAESALAIELNAVTDNPLVFPGLDSAQIEDRVVSAGHFHGMPIALPLTALKSAVPVLASISERRLNKLLDPATNDGLPAFLTGNEDATDSGYMIVQYTAAALVNDLATRAHPATVYSIPTSANAEDHVSMGANEALQLYAMLDQLEQALALELLVAAQALDLRRSMLSLAQQLVRRDGPGALIGKIGNAPVQGSAERARFEEEVRALGRALDGAGEFIAGRQCMRALALIRARVATLHADRPLHEDVAGVVELVRSGAFAEFEG